MHFAHESFSLAPFALSAALGDSALCRVVATHLGKTSLTSQTSESDFGVWFRLEEMQVLYCKNGFHHLEINLIHINSHFIGPSRKLINYTLSFESFLTGNPFRDFNFSHELAKLVEYDLDPETTNSKLRLPKATLDNARKKTKDPVVINAYLFNQWYWRNGEINTVEDLKARFNEDIKQKIERLW